MLVDLHASAAATRNYVRLHSFRHCLAVGREESCAYKELMKDFFLEAGSLSTLRLQPLLLRAFGYKVGFLIGGTLKGYIPAIDVTMHPCRDRGAVKRIRSAGTAPTPTDLRDEKAGME